MEAIPRDILLVDLIGSYTIRREVHDDPLILKASPMIDPKTGWFGIVKYNDKQSSTISNLVEQTWLCRYSRPTIFDLFQPKTDFFLYALLF